MLFLFISFMLTISAADSKGWVGRIGYFVLALAIGLVGGLMVLMTDKPLVIQWVLAWMTRA